MTAHLELDDVGLDEGSVVLILNGQTMLHCEPGRSEITDFNGNGIPDLTVKFDRQALIEQIGPGTAEITLTGSAQGRFFQETETIRVLRDK